MKELLLKLEDITILNVSHLIFEKTKRKYDKVFVVKNKGLFESAR